jgi:EmrB/QacA subfamily drug resistance transporter
MAGALAQRPDAVTPPTPDGELAAGEYSHRQILVILSGLILGMFLASLDQTVVSTSIYKIGQSLHGLTAQAWVTTAFLITSTIATPLYGKLGDMYGRKPFYLAAIAIFVVGSIACSFSTSMYMLAGFRAFQGIGAGGLFTLALAITGDIIPPRQRAKYQGYFLAVFGTSSVLGPVLGGFFTDGPGWRWIFYVNIPIGIVALIVTSSALKIPLVRREYTIDYVGAATIVAAVSSFLLYTTWAGPDHGWGSSIGLGLVAAGVLLTAFFVLVESRAAEPIIPLGLFKLKVFTMANLYSFIVGFAMFGGIIFLPVYLQVVQGFSPTKSGLALLPMVVGIFSTSISSGIVMSRTGRYKLFPILGALGVTVALLLLSTLTVSTPYWQAGLYFYLFGAGLGFSMQIIVTIVQNSVDRQHMGTATSSVTFFRFMGGTFGAAVFGAILSSRLVVHLAAQLATLPGGAGAGAVPTGNLANNVQRIQRLPEPIHGLVLNGFAESLHDVFLWAVPVLLVALVVSFFIPEVPLKARAEPGPHAAAEEEITLSH